MKPEISSDLGAVQVHNKVIVDVITSAIKDLDGIKLASDTMGEKLFGFLGRRQHFPGIDIKVDSQNNVSLEVKVILTGKINIPDAARQIQDAIKSELDKTVDINLKSINVHIQGIERGQK